MSSVVAGAVVSFVASPTELVKCRLQHQGTYEGAMTRWKHWDAGGRRGPQPTVYKGPWDALSHIYRHEGGVRGCCNGLGITLLRETPGNGLMFVVYEGLKMFLANWQVRGCCAPWHCPGALASQWQRTRQWSSQMLNSVLRATSMVYVLRRRAVIRLCVLILLHSANPTCSVRLPCN